MHRPLPDRIWADDRTQGEVLELEIIAMDVFGVVKQQGHRREIAKLFVTMALAPPQIAAATGR